MTVRLMLAVGCAMVGFTAKAGPADRIRPEIYIRAEDQQRARLLTKPCTKADVGNGCYRVEDFLVREAPCIYHIDAQTNGSLPVDQCVKMEKPRRYRGVWIDAFEGQEFISEGSTAPKWPQTDPKSPGWRRQFEMARASSIWLDVERAKLGHDFNNGNGRKMLIEFVGRKTLYSGSYGHMGMSGSVIIVDRLISLNEMK